MSEYFFAGAAEIDITPEIGLPMDGYTGRKGASLGTHDPLMAQLLILQLGTSRVVIISLDVLAVSDVFTQPLRQTLARILDTVPEAVVVCPTHTHCGPQGLQTWFPADAAPSLDTQLASFIQERLVNAAHAAILQTEQVQLVWSVGEISGIGGNRNQPHAKVDSQVTTLCCKRLDGSLKCILFHYACHPTVLGEDTCYYSADYIGAARNRLKAAYPDSIYLYLNGALGDVSSRYQRHDQSYAEVERLGYVLADTIIAMLQNSGQADPNLDLGWNSFTLDLPFRNLSNAVAPVIVTDSSDRMAITRAQGSVLQGHLKNALGDQTSQRVTLTRLRIGSWELFCVPGEPFNELASRIRQVLPETLVIGLVNDYAGYFPTQNAIDMQTYEALSSPYDARALRLIEAVFLNIAAI